MHVPQTEIVLRHAGVELVRVMLSPGEYVIGRAHDADICVETPVLSRQHARLTIHHDHLLLEDLASSNGTFVNEQPIVEATRLFPNQSIRLGPDIALEVRHHRTAAAPGVSLAPGQAAIARHLPPELLAEKRYSIGGIIARGGMGAILDVQQGAMKRRVAMKVMLDTGDEAAVLRFIDEAQITGQLDHPNIVPIYELGVDEQGQVFYTMKMVRGVTLHHVLHFLAAGDTETVEKYPLPVLLTVFQKVCDALAFAHSKGVIHRDLKPENLMLGDFGSLLVMDWGLAKILGEKDAPRSVSSARIVEGESGSTMAGAIMGTPAYMAPEQARGEIETLDARSDIYALGTILFEILHLRPALTGTTAMEIVGKAARGEIEWDARKKATVPDSLLAVCRKALALDPASRYRSVEDLQADVLAYQNGFATSAEKAGAWKQLTLFIRRHKAASIGAAAVLLIGGTLGTKAFVEGRRAARALADLNKAAPTLAAQAESLLAQGQLDAAIEQLDFALTIAPRDAGYRLRRAHLLQASLRLQEAAAAYRSALALGPDESASTNLALTEKLLAKWPATGQPDAQVLRELYDVIRAQGRIAESLPLGQRLGLGAQATEDAIRLVFRTWEKLPGWENGKRFVRETDGTFSFQLNGLPIQDLSPLRALRDLPISGVNLGQTLVTDLSPLAVLPLRDVNLVDSAVTDLAGLRGLKLKRLMIQSTKVRSLEPLRGMPLVWIDAAHCPELTDLEPLRGMALESLNLESSQKITSIDALSGMPLKGISVAAVPISDIRALRGMPLESAFITGPFQSLEPLKGAPLKSLLVTGALTDLNALRGSPIEDLLLAHCGGIKDFTPLLDCPRLNRLLIHPSSSGVEKLRAHPTLKLIGFDGQFRPVAEFLDEWEAQHKAVPK